MRVLIASAAAMTLVAAGAAGLALRTPPARPPHGTQLARAGEGAAPPTDPVPGLVWRSGTVALRLSGRPCPSDELAQAVEAEGVTQARAYDVTQGNRHFTGCWAKDAGGDVVTMEPGRELGSIPIGWFQAGG